MHTYAVVLSLLYRYYYFLDKIVYLHNIVHEFIRFKRFIIHYWMINLCAFIFYGFKITYYAAKELGLSELN